MSMTDPIADLLTRIRNAHIAKHDRLDVPSSKVKKEICRVLHEEGFIRGFRVLEKQPQDDIRIWLRYTDQGRPAIRHIARVSVPGRRVYRRSEHLKPVLNGLGVGVVSTSRGVLSDSQAREQRVGGEVLCEIW